MNDNKCFQVIWIQYFFFNNLRLVELLQRKLYGAESLEVNKCDLKDSEAVQIMRVRYEQYFNYVVLCLFTKLVKADYNPKFHPSIKNPRGLFSEFNGISFI